MFIDSREVAHTRGKRKLILECMKTVKMTSKSIIKRLIKSGKNGPLILIPVREVVITMSLNKVASLVIYSLPVSTSIKESFGFIC